MAAVMPSATNTFVRSHDATNKMVVDFARNVKDFALNRYVQIVPVKAMTGLYLEMTIEEAGRMLYADARNFIWADGHERPLGHGEVESFEYKPYRCERFAYPFTLGNLTIEQASWNILAQNARNKAQQAMTARTQFVVTQATTSGNYASTHRLDVTAISGNTGTWALSTTGRGDVKRSLMAAAEVILDDTVNAVQPNDLILVINSLLAARLTQCQEITDYLKSSPEALAQIRGELPGSNVLYGLPDKLYGFNLVVEATRKVTSRKGATRAVSQVLPTATPFMCSRPGGLVGVADAPNFSTHVLFAQEEMSVETLVDVNNRRTTGSVVDSVAAKTVAPASGVLFSNAV